MKHNLFLFFLLFVPVFSSLAQSDSVFRHDRLKNGLTYYVRHTRMQPGHASFYLVQNVGALMEEDNQNGLAHFLEHMAFNGSESFSEGIPNFLRRRGVGRFNAHTGQDETVYYMESVPTGDAGLVDSCLLVMRDWSGFLLLRPDEIDKERGVIFEERRSRRDLGARMREFTDPYIYNHSKYATRNVIGTVEVLQGFTPKELRDYYTDWYRPDLQAVIVVGDIDVAKVEKEIIRQFSPIPERENAKPRSVYEISDNSEPFYVKAIDKELSEPSMMFVKRMRKTPHASLKALMKENLLIQFYNNIVANKLQEYADVSRPLFLTTSVSYGELVRNYASWTITVQSFPNKEREAFGELMKEVERIHRFALNDKELAKQIEDYMPVLEERTKYKGQLPNEVYVQIYQNNFLEGKPLTSVDEDIALTREILSELTAADLQTWVASWNSDFKNWTFVMQGDNADYDFPTQKELLKTMTDVRQAELTARDLEVKAVPLMDFEVKGGEIVKDKKIKMLGGEEWTLSNGSKVYYRFSDQDGMKVSLMGESSGGMSLLPAEDLPSAMALSDLIMASGVYKHDRRMMQAILKGHQVNVGVNLGETFEGVQGVCDVSDAEMMFQLMYLFFEKPRFDQDEYDKYVYVNKMQSEITPPSINDTINEAMRRLRFNPSPRDWKVDAKYYDAMSFEKMEAIYRDRFRDASDFRFYLTGNIDREKARTLVEQYLGAIPSIQRKEHSVKYDNRRKGSMTETIEANIPDEKYVVNIEFSNHLKLKPEEELCMDLLQMELSDRYRDVIREAEGGAYGVKVMAGCTHHPEYKQQLAVGFQTSVEKGDRMRAIVHEQVQKVIDEGVDDADVEDRILMMKKGRENVLATRGNAHWMQALQMYADTGENLDDPARFEKVIDKISGKDVQALARKFFATAECVDIVIKSK